MRKGLGVALAIGMSTAPMAGCGGPEVIEQQASIEGFAYGVDSQLWDRHWVEHDSESYVPGGTVRNVRHREVFDHCVEVDDEMFSWNMDDSDCYFDFSCSADENEHCKAVYRDEYDYESLDDFVVQDCPAPIQKREFKPPNPVTNEQCDENRRGEQWVTRRNVFKIWISTMLTDKEGDKTLLKSVEPLSSDEWSLAERGADVTAVITDGQITDVKIS